MMEKGFTFIEIIVVSAIMAIIGLAILGLQLLVGQNQLSVWRNYVNINEANSSVKTMVREIRTARPADNGAYLLDTLGDNEIVFYSDIDYDSQAERVRYTLNGSDLEKGVIEPIGFPITYPQEDEKVIIVSENIKNQDENLFSYYNGDWPSDTVNNPLTLSSRFANTRTIRVYLILNTTDDTKQDYTLESHAQIRMLKSNL